MHCCAMSSVAVARGCRAEVVLWPSAEIVHEDAVIGVRGAALRQGKAPRVAALAAATAAVAGASRMLTLVPPVLPQPEVLIHPSASSADLGIEPVRGLVHFWKQQGAADYEPFVEADGVRYVRPYLYESHYFFEDGALSGDPRGGSSASSAEFQHDMDGSSLSGGDPAASAIANALGRDAVFWRREATAGRLEVQPKHAKGKKRDAAADEEPNGHSAGIGPDGGAGDCYQPLPSALPSRCIVRWRRHVHELPVPAGEPPAVLFEGSGVLALLKPPMVRTDGAYAKHSSMVAWAARVRRGAYAWPIHRLDRVVGGVLLFATSKAAYRKLKYDFEGRRVKKRYLARVAAVVEQGAERVVTACLRVEGTADGARPHTYVDPQGVCAKTVVRGLGVQFGDGTSLVECIPESGRQHQIRAHLQHIGWPVANDIQYGGAAPWIDEGPETFADDGDGSLRSALLPAALGGTVGVSPQWPEWGRQPCKYCEEIAVMLEGRVRRPRLSPGIWLFSQRYELPRIDVAVEAPLPDWAEPGIAL